MTTMTLPVTLRTLDSDTTVVNYDSLGSATFERGATFNNTVTFASSVTVSGNAAFVVLGGVVTALTTAQVSGFGIFNANPDNTTTLAPNLVTLVRVTINGSNFMIPAFADHRFE